MKKKLTNILNYYSSLSILKKFLFPSFLGLIFFIPFYLYLLSNTSNIKVDIQKVNSKHLPLLEKVYENKIILDKISTELNSAVVAREIEWAKETKGNFEQFVSNFKEYSLKTYLYKTEISNILRSFKKYYKTALDISIKLINTNSNYNEIHQEPTLLIKNYNNLIKELDKLNDIIKKRIKHNINSSYNTFDIILLKSMYIFMGWFILSITLIYFIYKDFSSKIKQIVKESESIASGDASFEKRMCSISYDEFGKVIRSFNMFIDKLHNNHLELQKTKEELSELYITDQLTGVYNRRKIDDLLEIEIKKVSRYNNRFSVILIDIDHFKSINDNYGHLIGDSVLKEFSSILKENIRDLDFLGRWGGEEFIIVCLETDIDGASLLAEKLRSKIANFPFTNVGKRTASFGVSTIMPKMTIDDLIESADKALYKAKDTGRDKVVKFKN